MTLLHRLIERFQWADYLHNSRMGRAQKDPARVRVGAFSVSLTGKVCQCGTPLTRANYAVQETDTQYPLRRLVCRDCAVPVRLPTP